MQPPLYIIRAALIWDFSKKILMKMYFGLLTFKRYQQRCQQNVLGGDFGVSNKLSIILLNYLGLHDNQLDLSFTLYSSKLSNNLFSVKSGRA